ncbi:MAG TPA: hypothetical protein VGD80_22015 [Kofleriaceae bacterium]
MTTVYRSPGVSFEQVRPTIETPFLTGVPGFLGSAIKGDHGALSALPVHRLYTSWREFADEFRATTPASAWRPDEALWNAVQGFFGNGGVRCHVVFYDPTATGDRLAALDLAVTAMAELDDIEDIDLLCAPSLVTAVDPAPLQQQLIRSSERVRAATRTEWFLILDAPPRALATDLADWANALHAGSKPPLDAALYGPWLFPGGAFEPAPWAKPPPPPRPTPPSGHVAGIYARTDRRVGVHKAPANEEILGVVDIDGDAPEIATINPLRAIPGRGIRVFGARTLARVADGDPDGFVNIRRLVLTLERWLVRALAWAVFEPNDFRLWVRIHRELEDKLTELFRRGAFRGKAPSDGFRIKCDEENNPAELRASGQLQVDVQIAPAVPQEFITIRLIRSGESLTVA